MATKTLTTATRAKKAKQVPDLGIYTSGFGADRPGRGTLRQEDRLIRCLKETIAAIRSHLKAHHPRKRCRCSICGDARGILWALKSAASLIECSLPLSY